MKIDAYPDTAVAGQGPPLPASLGDDAKKEYIKNYLPSTKRSLALKGGYQQDFKKPLNRYNKSTEVSWQVDRHHESIDDCQKFARDHENSVPTNCYIQIEVGTSITIFDGCFINEVRFIEQDGEGTVVQYTAVLGKVRST